MANHKKLTPISGNTHFAAHCDGLILTCTYIRTLFDSSRRKHLEAISKVSPNHFPSSEEALHTLTPLPE